MTDTGTPAGSGTGGGFTIPADVQQKYPELIELIKASESMNDEERQYWINILPIMTPEQVQNLRDILENEKKQLAAIDEKYRSDAPTASATPAASTITQEERRRKRHERQTKEASHKEQEEKSAEDLLQTIEKTDI